MKKAIEWHTETRKISDLNDHPKNPRNFTEKGMSDLGKSLKNLGYIDLIAINLDGTIIGGHARRKKLIEQGKTECEVRVPSRGLDEKEVEEALIRLNKNTAGEWNMEKLGAFEQEELVDWGFEKSEFNSFSSYEHEERPKGHEYPLFSQKKVIEEAFTVFRQRGFPYPKMDRFEMMMELNKLASLPADGLLGSIAGYNIADHYHSHRFLAAAYKMRSPVEGFLDDTALRKTLKMALDQGDILTYKKLSFMSLVNGVQACSNFRPAYARMIYDKYANGGTVFDSSTGYGGRLVGFLASSANSYIGVDPNIPTHKANLQLAEDLGQHKAINLHNCPIEDLDVRPYADGCDLAFTSPPYFVKEQYSADDTQSCVRYKAYDEWRDKFLLPMLGKQFVVLRAGGMNIINIEDVTIGSKSYALVKDTIDIAAKVGFIYEKTEKFDLYKRTKMLDGEKISESASESVIIMRKP